MLITGFDILFFWVARMMFQSENALEKLPFKDIYLHALVKTATGEKMSKSSGNVIFKPFFIFIVFIIAPTKC